jgi:hypothetical protein
MLAAAMTPSCIQDRIEQVNFYVTFDSDAHQNINELARIVAKRARMKLFYAHESKTQTRDSLIEIYGDDLSIDMGSVPCDPKGDHPEIKFSRNAFFVSVTPSRANSRRDSLERIANLYRSEARALGGRISTQTPAC